MGSGVARLFDAMADSYDELEPWYAHLYGGLHAILRAELVPPDDGVVRCALDAGCGTGLQAAELEGLGYCCHGVDLSPRLLHVAKRRLERTALALGSIEALPYGDECFDVVSCCGSTLSLVDAPDATVREIGRVLRPGGSFLLECEHKWNLDLAWALLSGLTFDSLGYGVSPVDIWRQLARPLGEGFVLDYPCPMPDGTTGWMRLRLFTLPELERLLRGSGLTLRRTWGIHAFTNLIPSTILHRARLGHALAVFFRRLCAIDRALRRFPATARLANSVVILARKEPSPPATSPRPSTVAL